MLVKTLCTPLRTAHGGDQRRSSLRGNLPRFLSLSCNNCNMNHAVCTSSGYEDRVIGCFLGALCGDVLGAAVEGWNAQRVKSTFEKGITEFQDTSRGYGFYTDDSQMLLALAASLVNKGHCCVQESTRQCVLAFDPERGYGGTTVKILTQLTQGADPATIGTQFLPGGSFGNGGAMRIAPLCLAYRNAHLDTITKAVQDALLCTHHVHPLGLEGALTQALAVAQLSRTQHQSTVAVAPQDLNGQVLQQQESRALQLLQNLKQQLTGRSQEMCDKLTVLEEGYAQMPQLKSSNESWQSYLRGPGWPVELAVSGQVAPGFQIKATDAVAAALWAVVSHWESPLDACVAAVHYGGDTDTIACMAGAMMGALHGSAWIPKSWLDNLENHNELDFFNQAAVDAVLAADDTSNRTEAAASAAQGCEGQRGQQQELVRTTRDMGRDGAIVLARLLARLDCK